MKKFIAAIILALFCYMVLPAPVVEAKMAKSTTVKGYSKKNGTYVHSHSSTRHYNTTKKRK